jgi:hypothetical protein
MQSIHETSVPLKVVYVVVGVLFLVLGVIGLIIHVSRGQCPNGANEFGRRHGSCACWLPLVPRRFRSWC